MSKKVKFGFIAVAIAVFLVLITNLIHGCTERKKVELEQQIDFLQEEFSPMAFEISKTNNSEIKFKIVFYDINGNKVGSQVLKLTGEELNFDFQVIKLSDKSFLFFPCGVYTEQIAINDAAKITDAYNDNGFPKIYNGLLELEDEKGKKLDLASKNNITDSIKMYYAMVMDGQTEFDTDAHGVAVHDIKNVYEFKKGFVYEVICHPHTGGIEIIRK